MPSRIPNEQLSSAVYQAVRDGAYPEQETIVSAELSAIAIDKLLETLEEARAEVKV